MTEVKKLTAAELPDLSEKAEPTEALKKQIEQLRMNIMDLMRQKSHLEQHAMALDNQLLVLRKVITDLFGSKDLEIERLKKQIEAKNV